MRSKRSTKTHDIGHHLLCWINDYLMLSSGMTIIEHLDVSAINLPPVLYKYREFNNSFHKSIITNSSVYFAAPNTFPDNKDCHPKEVFPSVSIVRKRFWELSLSEHPEMNRYERDRYVHEQIISAPILNPDIREQLIEDLFGDYCRCHGILSVTANPNNKRMWEEYADDHKGFCVGFNSSKLAMIAGGGGPVTYCDSLPEIHIWLDNQESEFLKRVFYKERKWEHEEEYRLIKVWRYDSDVTNRDRNVQLPPDGIVSVICGKDMPIENVEVLRTLLNQYHPNASLSIESF